MIIVTASVQLVTYVANATTWDVAYADAEVEDTPTTASGAVSTATTTEIIPAPGAGIDRYVRLLRLENTGGSSQVCAVTSAGDTLAQFILAVGETRFIGGDYAVKLSGDSTLFLNGAGTWASAGGGGPHAANHASGGSDPVQLDDLAAPDDNTDLNATTTAHGLLQKLPGGTTTFLRADGAFAAPAGGSGMTSAQTLARGFCRC